MHFPRCHLAIFCATLAMLVQTDLTACGMCSSLGLDRTRLHVLSPDGSGYGGGQNGGLVLGGTATIKLGSFGIAIAAGAQLAANTAAFEAFQRAADTWGSFISDPVQITITADLADLGNPNTIGSASSFLLQGGFDLLRNAMLADDPGDPLLQALPMLDGFSATLPAGINLGSDLLLTKANGKALGFTGLDLAFGVSDATITFNSTFAFDYDRGNGITPGTIDFESVALHEIGHALGFISSVDDVDYAKANNLTAADLRVLDLIGYNVIPEPSAVLSLVMAGSLMLTRRPRHGQSR